MRRITTALPGPFRVVSITGDFAVLQHLDPVPFIIDNESGTALTETQGLLGSDGTNLVIEFRVVEWKNDGAIFGTAKGKLRTVAVPLAELQSVLYRSRSFALGAFVEVCARRQRVLESFPESKMGMVRLRIKRRGCPAAKAFCMAVREALGRMRNEQLMDDLNRLERGDGEALA